MKSYQVNNALAIRLSGKLMLTLQDVSFNILMVVNFSVDDQHDGFVLSKKINQYLGWICNEHPENTEAMC